MRDHKGLIPAERIESLILVIRSHKAILDADIAELYAVDTKALNQAVRRNIERFPEDFVFQLSVEEFDHLRSQVVTAKWLKRRYPSFCTGIHQTNLSTINTYEENTSQNTVRLTFSPPKKHF